MADSLDPEESSSFTFSITFLICWAELARRIGSYLFLRFGALCLGMGRAATSDGMDTSDSSLCSSAIFFNLNSIYYGNAFLEESLARSESMLTFLLTGMLPFMIELSEIVSEACEEDNSRLLSV